MDSLDRRIINELQGGFPVSERPYLEAAQRIGTSESEFIVRGGLNYRWILSETAEFIQALSVESGETNTYSESVTALKASLLGELALVASYTIKNNSDVVPGTEKTDTYTALSLEYAF